MKPRRGSRKHGERSLEGVCARGVTRGGAVVGAWRGLCGWASVFGLPEGSGRQGESVIAGGQLCGK